MKKNLRLGLIGLGNVACNNYLPFLSRQENVELYCCSRSPEKAKACAERFGIHACGTPKELAGLKPDAIFLTVPEEHHCDIACELLEDSPKRLFLEKPLHARHGQANVREEDFFEGLDFLKRAKECGTEIAVNFNYRFLEQTLRIRRLMESGTLGGLRESAWIVNYACWSHCIDLLRWFGGEVEQVSAIAGSRLLGTGALQAADLAGAFTMESGGTGIILGTSGSAFEQSLYHAVLHFEHGSVSFSDLDAELRMDLHGSDYRQIYELTRHKSRWDSYAASFEKSLGAYLESIVRGTPPPVSGMDGLRELQFEAALRRAAGTGRRVVVAAEFAVSL